MELDEILSIPLLLSLSWMLGRSLDVVFSKRLDRDNIAETPAD